MKLLLSISGKQGRFVKFQSFGEVPALSDCPLHTFTLIRFAHAAKHNTHCRVAEKTILTERLSYVALSATANCHLYSTKTAEKIGLSDKYFKN